MSQYDVVIVGGGIVGLTTALALALKTHLSIALVDAKPLVANWQSEVEDRRVSAISLASQRIFQQLNVWDSIVAKRVSPYRKMFVWDESTQGQIQFDSAELALTTLGHIIEDGAMRASLLAALQQCDAVTLLSSQHFVSLERGAEGIALRTQDGVCLSARLVVAADGGHSWVREKLAIALDMKDYAHTAIVASVQTTLPHDATAWQCFKNTGPLAFLPLQDLYRASIVWSTTPEHAAELLQLSDANFLTELTQAFQQRLGDVIAVSERQHFPLMMRHAKQYVQAGVALVGDAAHTIHPLAGQGVNLGLLDAACLVDVITDALVKQRDFASLAQLRRYERWRKGENAMMLTMVGFLKDFFAAKTPAVRQVRSVGLNLVNRLDYVKNYFMQYALGQRAEMPSLTQKII